MSITNDLSRLANSANVLVNSITVNSTAIVNEVVAGTISIGNSASNVAINSTSISVGGTPLNATSFSGTANNTLYVGSVTAANVVSNAQLQANVTTIQGQITSNAAAAYTNAVAYSDGKSYVNTSQLSSNLANYALLSGGLFTGSVNSTSYNVGTAFTANSTMTNTVSLVVSTNTVTIGNGTYFVSNGNIGIATGTPATKLDIIGGERNYGLTILSSSILSGANQTTVDYLSTAPAKSRLLAWGPNTSTKGTLSLGILSSDASQYSDAIYITNNGNTGIGTTTPYSTLTVTSGGTVNTSISLGSGDPSTGTWIRNDSFNTVFSTNIGSMYYGLNGSSKNLYFYPGGSTSALTVDTNSIVYATSQFRTPVFYDQDNTAYYVDPNNTTNLNAMQCINGYFSGTGTGLPIQLTAGISTSAQVGIGFNGSDNNYGIYKPAGTWTQPLQIYFYTGIRHYSHQSYDYGQSFWNISSGNLMATFGQGDDNTRINYNLYAPIMYDSNDTSYYCNPNSTSVFNTLNTYAINLPSTSVERDISWLFTGRNTYFFGRDSDKTVGLYDSVGSYRWTSDVNNQFIVYGALLAKIMYDYDNTGYYVDPASTSVLNVCNIGSVSKATSGYSYLPNGMIMQWGITGSLGAGGPYTVTFPLAFPNAGYFATNIPTVLNLVGQCAPTIASLSTANFTFYNETGTTNAFRWFAIGY